ncbi:hypothetical protein PR048_014189, partial [Dryococelus australis]
MESEDDLGIEFSESESESASELSSEDEIGSSESFEDILASARQWVQINTSAELPPAPPRYPFLGEPAIHFEFSPDDDITLYLSVFHDGELLNIVVTETNRYTSDKDIPQWKATSIDEMQTFICVILQSMGGGGNATRCIGVSNLQLQLHFFRQVLGYKLLLQLKKCLHFSDSSVYVPLNHPQSSVYTPERDVTIDESLILYKGRLGWVQYMPLIRARFGIKTFMICESLSGKCTHFHKEFENFPQRTQIVLILMKPLMNKDYCLTVDNSIITVHLNLLTAPMSMVLCTRKEETCHQHFAAKKLEKVKLQFLSKRESGRQKGCLHDVQMVTVQNTIEQWLAFPISESCRTKKIKHHPTRLCGMCSRVRDSKGKKARRESLDVCEDCDVALCIVPCFKAFHTATNIKNQLGTHKYSK